MTRHRPLLAVALLATSSAAAAAAAEPAARLSVEGSLAMVSDYRFRGISLSEGDPAVQGGATARHSSGLYVGAWGSTIGGDARYGSAELDLFAGWSGEIAPALTLDGTIAYYAYPDGDDALGKAEYLESTARLGRSLGPLEIAVGASYAWRQAALDDRDNLFLFADASADLPGTAIALKAHAGHSAGALAPDGRYADWSIGAETAFGPLTLGITYVDTDLADAPEARAAILFSLAAEF